MARRNSKRTKRKERETAVGVTLVLLLFLSAHFYSHAIRWWWIAALAAITLFQWVYALYEPTPKPIKNASLDEIDQMVGEDFERVLWFYLRELGWNVNTTVRTGDFGADLRGKDASGIPVVIQAKRWKDNVNVEAINQVLGAREYYGAKRMIVITNQKFTPNAQELARRAKVEMWGRKELFKIIRASQKRKITNRI